MDESKAGNKPFGYKAALDALAKDEDFSLYECEIGLFTDEDASTPIDIKNYS